MPILKRMGHEDLARFSHRGWFMWCPIYIGNIESEAPLLSERNWIPEWWLTANEFVFGVCMTLATMIWPDYEPMFPLKITGPLR